MAITQARAFGAGTGGRYGSFAGRIPARTVDTLTQTRASGAHTGGRYGSFAGRAPTAPPPAPAPAPIGPIGSMRLPPHLAISLRHRLIEEDDVLLLMAAQISGLNIH